MLGTFLLAGTGQGKKDLEQHLCESFHICYEIKLILVVWLAG